MIILIIAFAAPVLAILCGHAVAEVSFKSRISNFQSRPRFRSTALPILRAFKRNLPEIPGPISPAASRPPSGDNSTSASPRLKVDKEALLSGIRFDQEEQFYIRPKSQVAAETVKQAA